MLSSYAICIYIYIYTHYVIYYDSSALLVSHERCRGREPDEAERASRPLVSGTANLPTNIVDFGGFDSSIMLNLRGGIPRPKGNFPEILSQAMLLGVMLVGRLGVPHQVGSGAAPDQWIIRMIILMLLLLLLLLNVNIPIIM